MISVLYRAVDTALRYDILNLGTRMPDVDLPRRTAAMDSVLFACVHNAGRSQMAAALFNAVADPRLVRAVSAGTIPADRVHPLVVEVMREVGIDLSSERPRLLTDVLARCATLLVTMGCGDACPYVPGLARDDWPLPDPANRPIEEVRRIRDEIRARVAHLVALRRWERERRTVAAKRLVAHRGASAYAPEHTLASYRLALRQGADYVEQDLAVTKDGVLICLHDESLERTTNVKSVFRERATVDPATGRRHWFAADFTVAEIKQLDAGRWFDARYTGEQVPTWAETVETVGNEAFLCPELKSPQFYRARGWDMVELFVDAFLSLGLGARPADSLLVQSFDEDTLRRLGAALPGVPRLFLIGRRDSRHWLTPAGFTKIAAFAGAIGPHKSLLRARPALVTMAHEVGLAVIPYTFTTRKPLRALVRLFADVQTEMHHFLYDLDVDGVFTDNPDRFPRSPDRKI